MLVSYGTGGHKYELGHGPNPSKKQSKRNNKRQAGLNRPFFWLPVLRWEMMINLNAAIFLKVIFSFCPYVSHDQLSIVVQDIGRITQTQVITPGDTNLTAGLKS